MLRCKWHRKDIYTIINNPLVLVEDGAGVGIGHRIK